ncbi:MAG: KTSC domain-containing protein [Caldilineaceae bacterium]|nr:KTSC domain-containing protein [Caldilineaceae bacterium]
MEREQVSSTNLASVGYDPATQILEIEFHSGGVYQYAGVPAALYEGLMAASSHGSYFDHFIKKAGYEYRRIR